MWHINVINHEEYKLFKCRNHIINVVQANILKQHDQPHHTVMHLLSRVSTLAESSFPH